MKIVLAPNALKGSLSATQAALAMADGAARAAPGCELIHLPVADGGDGMVEVIAAALGGEIKNREVTGPRGQRVRAEFCLFPGRPPLSPQPAAVVEMALASGLALLAQSERDPLQATTYGTGELLAAALSLGARQVLVGVGGSATVDGGIGMAAALGIRFLDARGKELEPIGASLEKINRLDLSRLFSPAREADFVVACDVENPLLGMSGAARIYGPQKGASCGQVVILEAGLANLADCIERDLGLNVRSLPGGGAAGGLAAGLHAFLGARLVKGVDLVLDLLELAEALRGADLVLTAEGALDAQTSYGKAPAGVARAARAAGVPCIALAGKINLTAQELEHNGFAAAYAIKPVEMTVAESMRNAYALLSIATDKAIREFIAD